MQCYVVVAVLVGALSVAECALDRDQSIKLLEKCKAETKASEDPVTTYDTQKIPETKEGKCMMACVLREKGLMKNGKMDQQAIVDFAESTYKDEPEKLEKAAEAVGACATLDVKGLDQCETAYKYLVCGQQKGVVL